MTEKRIFKILGKEKVTELFANGSTDGSELDQRDGFLHFSTASQLPGTLAKHYDGVFDLSLLEVDATEPGLDVRWEYSRDGKLFPHLYGKLSSEYVKAIYEILEGKEGHILPDGLS